MNYTPCEHGEYLCEICKVNYPMSDLYEKCRALIVSAVPEIMDVTFGCEVRYPKNEGYAQKVCGTLVDEIDGMENVVTEVDIMWFNGKFKTIPIEAVEILGRPIRLADCVYAYLQSLHPTRCLGRGYSDETKLGMYDSVVMNIIGGWNLSKDDLSQQSPETLSFLISLLE